MASKQRPSASTLPLPVDSPPSSSTPVSLLLFHLSFLPTPLFVARGRVVPVRHVHLLQDSRLAPTSLCWFPRNFPSLPDRSTPFSLASCIIARCVSPTTLHLTDDLTQPICAPGTPLSHSNTQVSPLHPKPCPSHLKEIFRSALPLPAARLKASRRKSAQRGSRQRIPAVSASLAPYRIA